MVAENGSGPGDEIERVSMLMAAALGVITHELKARGSILTCLGCRRGEDDETSVVVGAGPWAEPLLRLIAALKAIEVHTKVDGPQFLRQFASVMQSVADGDSLDSIEIRLKPK
jgi:hypothetical protein